MTVVQTCALPIYILRDFLNNIRGVYIFPHYELLFENLPIKSKGGHYNKDEYIYKGPKLVSKRTINIWGNLSKKAKPPVCIVLSAINTKDYIEHIFTTKIKDENCFGSGLINVFPNVISTNYYRKHRKVYTRSGISKQGTKHERTKESIQECIGAFIERYHGRNICIAGIKSVFNLIKKKYFFYIQDTCVTYSLIRYDDYIVRKNNGELCDTMIPYLHFGISGINDFASFTAMLAINNYFLPPYHDFTYSNCNTINNDNFSISRNSYFHNVVIAPVRQLEGRLLRFSGISRIKYIHRLNYYDHRESYKDTLVDKD